MTKVILDGFIEVSQNDLELVKEALPHHIDLTRKESGCLVFEVSQDQAKKNIFNVYEEFVNQEAFDFHQKRVRLSRWGEVARNVKRHYIVKNIE